MNHLAVFKFVVFNLKKSLTFSHVIRNYHCLGHISKYGGVYQD